MVGGCVGGMLFWIVQDGIVRVLHVGQEVVDDGILVERLGQGGGVVKVGRGEVGVGVLPGQEDGLVMGGVQQRGPFRGRGAERGERHVAGGVGPVRRLGAEGGGEFEGTRGVEEGRGGVGCPYSGETVVGGGEGGRVGVGHESRDDGGAALIGLAELVDDVGIGGRGVAVRRDGGGH